LVWLPSQTGIERKNDGWMDRYIYELTDALIDRRKIARKKGRRKKRET
jgi:hypothetical protein